MNFKVFKKVLVLSIILICAFAGCGEKAALPASTKIAFSSNRDGPYQIYVMNGDGTGQTRLTNHMASDAFPAWSPDGAKIAFSSNSDINVMNADGSDQKKLTNSSDNQHPAWSPDGTRIAFCRYGKNEFDRYEQKLEIYVMNADGSDQKKLTNSSAGASDPTWSPDDSDPTWSPDGTRIVYSSNRDIYVMNADGSDQKKLTNASAGASDSDPAWSPDGTKIAFDSSDGNKFEIYVMNADGSNPKKLSNISFIQRIIGGSPNDGYPTWSQDSAQIAFFGHRDGNNEICVMNADGSGQTQLTNNQAEDFQPAIRPVK